MRSPNSERLRVLVLSVAALTCAAAQAGLEGFDLGAKAKAVAPAPAKAEELVAVEEPLGEEDLAAARRAAERRATIDASGAVTVPKVATTRTVLKPKAEAYAPPLEIAADAKRLTHYFCELWKAGEYERMYYAMEPAFRETCTFEAFAERFRDDAALTGGLAEETIRPEVSPSAKGVRLTVTLEFRWPKASPRTVVAEFARTKAGFCLTECGIIPAAY